MTSAIVHAMATTVAPSRRPLARPTLAALNRWHVLDGLALVVLIAVSLYLHSRRMGVSFWADEGLSVGIASHGFFHIPAVLHQDGSPPLYYMLLHLWIGAFGTTEAATHWLSLLISTLAIPAGLWVGWSLFGRRAGWICAALMAFNSFLAAYGHETRMYTLVALLSLLAVGAYLHAFLYGRRRYIPVFGVLLAALVYTHNWGIFFGIGAVVALAPIARWVRTDDRRRLAIDAVLGFGLALLLYVPWIPTILFQAAHTGAPWSNKPRLGTPIQISRYIIGGDRITVALLLGAGAGLAALWVRSRSSRERTSAISMVVLLVVTLAIAWALSQISPAWTTRYLAVIMGPLFLVIALGCARAGRLGIAAVVIGLLLSAPPRLYTVKHKSDADAIAAQVDQRLRPDDLVVVTQPEQVPLMHYYLPGGLRYADEMGLSRDPRVVNWADALPRLQRESPRQSLAPLVAGLRPGQHLLLVEPITDDAGNWEAPWTSLVRRRSAQWGQAAANDPRLVPTAVAPHYYQGATTIGLRAVLYTAR